MSPLAPGDSQWYRDAIIYELHIRAFADSNGDGIGDFPGLISKLDYLQDLGVTAIWLLPFYPSPGRDDGYDIADYTTVNPTYGKLADVRRLVKEAHARGLRVITELVANHTSDQHPWFQRARRAKKGSAARDFYVWSDTSDRYQEARIIFKDFETSNWSWDPVAGQYYWHRFYSHQPDLNFENPQVRKAILKALDFWMEMGVDGLRLDAVPYLFEREGTNCENLPETHAVLREIRAHMDANYQDRMLLAEANQWPEDAVAYFGSGDECHMNFHFPLMPRLFMSIQMEDRFPVVDILAQTPAIPEGTQWALFLRNHDELTLEMVTDEERDYMYRVYTQDPTARINLGIRRRLAPLLSNNRRRIELMNGLLFSLPGTPVVYYGDEIGMGDNIYLGDRNGVRTPMQWSADRNAGFSRANRQKLFLPVIVDPEYHYESVNVETQAANPHSLLSWMRRMIELRKRHPAFGRGTLEFLHPENRKVLAYLRRLGEELILVVANLSRYVQFTELDLSAFREMIPVELFGMTDFPPIGDLPYFLTLGPHAFYWFRLQPQRVALEVPGGLPADLPELVAVGGWEELFSEAALPRFEEILPSWLRQRRWYAGKSRRLRSVRVTDCVRVPFDSTSAMVLTVLTEYGEGDPATYVVPVAFAGAEVGEELVSRRPDAVLCRVSGGVLYDALIEPAFPTGMLDAIANRRRFKGARGTITGTPTRILAVLNSRGGDLEAALSTAEQSNNSVVFGERMIMKLFRRLDEGENPDLEVGRFLTERAGFSNVAPVAGSLEYRAPGRAPGTLGMLQGYVPNQGDAWAHTQHQLDAHLGRSDLGAGEIPGTHLDQAALLGRRTAELHLALASDPDDPAFAPAPSTMLDQRSAYQAARTQAGNVFQLLRGLADRLPPATRPDAKLLLDLEGEVQARLRALLQRPITACRIRVHGDYHLGQVLWTGSDFVVVDFEGEPARSLAERRLKRWPQKDVAGMLRSYAYAAATAVRNRRDHPDPRLLEAAARRWQEAIATAFLGAYSQAAGAASFIPPGEAERRILLEHFLFEKAIYEIRYELNSRPDWVGIPIRGILDLMGVT